MEQDLRLFAALPLPEDLVDRLVAVQRSLDRHWPPRSVRWVRRDQLHLTVRFYGNVAPSDAPALLEALRGACAGTGPLDLNLTGLGGFPDPRHPRVVWAGVSGDVDGLDQLQERIEAATGIFGEHQETREFQPHLTLGRVAFDRGRQPALPSSPTWTGLETDDLGHWTATAVHLIRSQLDPTGARYTLLSAAPLAAR
jgi:2'-5' RNA ligase